MDAPTVQLVSYPQGAGGSKVLLGSARSAEELEKRKAAIREHVPPYQNVRYVVGDQVFDELPSDLFTGSAAVS